MAQGKHRSWEESYVFSNASASTAGLDLSLERVCVLCPREQLFGSQYYLAVLREYIDCTDHGRDQ